MSELKPWIAENQLEWVLSNIDPNTLFLEWGAGGSSVWFHQRLEGKNVGHIVIESDHSWAQRVEDEGVVVKRTHESFKRSQHCMECGVAPLDYICRQEALRASVILVDGLHRGAVLAWCSAVCATGTLVFLHDCEFDFFQWATCLPNLVPGEIVPSKEPNVNSSPMRVFTVLRR